MNNNFGERLISIRTSKGITQEQLASEMGASRQAISKWERNQGLPDLYNIQQLASILGVSVDYLINDSTTHQRQASIHDQKQQNGMNFIKNLLYKARHTTNTKKAQKIKNWLLIGGGLGVLIGVIISISGFYGFVKGGFDSVNNFGSTGFPENPTDFYNPGGFTEPKAFNPIPYMAMFMGGGFLAGISMYAVYGGLAITVAKVTTNFLDDRAKCPKCGDEVDADEDVCSTCGFKLKEHSEKECSCGKINKASDAFCRSCGLALNKSHP